MSFKEKSTWIMAVATFGAYVVYVALVLGNAELTALTEVSYTSPMLWTICAMVIVAVVAHIAVAVASPDDADKEDQRDREISGSGKYTGSGCVDTGGLSSLGRGRMERRMRRGVGRRMGAAGGGARSAAAVSTLVHMVFYWIVGVSLRAVSRAIGHRAQ